MRKILFIITAALYTTCLFAGEDNACKKSMPDPDSKVCVGNPKQARAQQHIYEADIPPPPPHEMTQEEAQMLKTLFLMPNQELAKLREMISKLEKTPMEHREKMAKNLELAMKATPEERKKMMEKARERFRKMQENLLNKYYATLSQEQADEEREKFLKLDHDGKRQYINEIREKLGLPPHGPKGEKRDREQGEQRRDRADKPPSPQMDKPNKPKQI